MSREVSRATPLAPESFEVAVEFASEVEALAKAEGLSWFAASGKVGEAWAKDGRAS